jgi:4-amino-4-deoxy-L-arabinose transferase-like glycosyltransferase
MTRVFNEKSILVVLLLVFGVLLFIDLPGSHLFDPDETRYAEIAREMLATGDYLTPRLNGSHYFEKPPLSYWLNAAAMAVFGQSSYVARLTTRMATVGILLILIFSLSTSKNAGLWAALVYISSPLPFALGRIVLTDGVLTFALTMAFFSLRGMLLRFEEGRKTTVYQIGLGIGVAMAVMTKGLIGIIFPFLVLFLWCAIVGRWKYLKKITLSGATLLAVVLSIPWFILMERTHPGFSKYFFYQEHVLRYATNYAQRPGSFFYFPLVFIAGIFPWLIFFGKAIGEGFNIQRRYWVDHSDDLFFILWMFVILLFFSLSQSKLIPYILPAYPAMAAFLGKWMAESSKISRKLWSAQSIMLTAIVAASLLYALKSKLVIQQELQPFVIFICILLFVGAWGSSYLEKITRRAHVIYPFCWAGVYFVLILAVPNLSTRYSDFHLADEASKVGGDTIVCYQYFSPSFSWVIKDAAIPVAAYDGELASDGQRQPRLFWDADTFWRRWNSDEKIVVYVREKDAELFNGPRVKKSFRVAKNHRSFVLSNFKTDLKET